MSKSLGHAVIVAFAGVCLMVSPLAGAAAELSEKGELTFKETSYRRLPVKAGNLERPFQWPSQEAFRKTHSLAQSAGPIPLLHGHLVTLEGQEFVNSLGPAPTWEDVVAFLPEARRQYEQYLKRRNELFAQATGRKESYEENEALQALFENPVYVEECPEALLAFQFRGGKWLGVEFLERGDCRGRTILSSLDILRDQSGQPLVAVDGTHVMGFKPAHPHQDSSIKPDLWEAWTYSSTLLELSRPLYEAVDESNLRRLTAEERKQHYERQAALETDLEKALKRGLPEALEGIQQALEANIVSRARGLGEAAGLAEQEGELELALQLRSRFRPVGLCSMDTAPQEAARSYSELCFKMGDLACFLNLQVRIMGDAFPRVAYSTYGEASHQTEAERLWDIGIDVNRFLQGLVVQFAVDERERIELDAWRLARSIKESGLAEEMETFLKKLAFDRDTDAYNRFRSTTILAYLSYQQQKTKPFDKTSHRRAWSRIQQEFEGMALSPEARLWLDSLASRLQD